MDIILRGNRAETKGKPDMKKLLPIFSRFEGKKNILKTGNFSFENTPYNLSLWMYTFPLATVDDTNIKDDTVLAQFADNDRPKFKFKRESMWWQAEAHEKFKNVGPGTANPYPCFAFLYDPGAGKSKSLTDAMCYLYCENKIDAAIIVAPNELVSEQWPMKQLPNDIHDDIPSKAWIWDKTKSKKSQRAYEDLKEFQGLQVISLNIDALKTKDGSKLVMNFINKHKGRVLFAFDESQYGKNPSSQRHKALDAAMGRCDWRAILTGTLIAKNLVDAWAQFKLLDPRILGYKYMSSFRNEFCELRFNGFANEIVGHKNIDKFYKLIEPYSYRISKSELGYEKLYDTFEFSMSPEQKAVFKTLKEEFIAQLDSGELMTVSNALSATVRMQQVTCGYLPLEDGSYQIFPNSRLEALKAWLETMEGEKVVIWCRFLHDVKFIKEALGKACIDLSGNVTSDERIVNKNRFIKEPDVLYAIGTPDAAGTGTDGLQEVCNRAIYYSNSYNSLLRAQSEDRTSRLNGETTSFYTDLVCKGGIDRRILRNLQSKKDLAKLTLDDIRLMFKEEEDD